MSEKQRKLQQEALRKAHVYQRLFHSAEGPIILEDLKNEFDLPPLSSAVPHYSHVRVGHLEVLRYIEDVLKIDTAMIGDDNA